MFYNIVDSIVELIELVRQKTKVSTTTITEPLTYKNKTIEINGTTYQNTRAYQRHERYVEAPIADDQNQIIFYKN